jgi:hypothetical protein
MDRSLRQRSPLLLLNYFRRVDGAQFGVRIDLSGDLLIHFRIDRGLGGGVR